MIPRERKYTVKPVVISLMCECGTEMTMAKLVNQNSVNTWHYKCSGCGEECRVAKEYPILEYIEVPDNQGCGPNCKCSK